MVDAARLRRRSDISAVRARGRAHSDRFVFLRSRTSEVGSVRLAVTAMRECGPAIRRNRARRRVREAIRQDLRARPTAPSMDLVVAARATCLTAPFAELREVLHRDLDVVLRP